MPRSVTIAPRSRPGWSFVSAICSMPRCRKRTWRSLTPSANSMPAHNRPSTTRARCPPLRANRTISMPRSGISTRVICSMTCWARCRGSATDGSGSSNHCPTLPSRATSTPCWLTTGPIPYAPGIFEIQFDFQKHEVNVSTSEGPRATRPLRGESVASFYSGIFEALGSLGIAVEINLMPQEVAEAVPFNQDYADCYYDPEYANRLWRILVSSGKVLERFRAKFTGKCSPVHFFWGSFDLACRSEERRVGKECRSRWSPY